MGEIPCASAQKLGFFANYPELLTETQDSGTDFLALFLH
jgi:hypothetical protein